MKQDYIYKYKCTDPGIKGKDINEMKDIAIDVTYETMLKHCDIQGVMELFFSGVYAQSKKDGLTIKNDWHIYYYKSIYRGKKCYYLRHSSIEYIFLKENS